MVSKSTSAALICTDEDLGIKVLYCLSALDIVTHVVGHASPRFINASRHCDNYAPIEIPAADADKSAFARQLDAYVRLHAIDVLVPADEVAAGCLAEINGELTNAKCFPVIDRWKYDELHNKWRFAQHLGQIGLPCPTTLLISSAGDLDGEALLRLGFPMICKPLALWGGAGVVKVKDFGELDSYVRGDVPDSQLPFIVQEFIPGYDIDLSVLAIDGELVASTVQRWIEPGIIEFTKNQRMEDIGRRIAAHFRLNGVAHFDMRVDERNGEIVVIECNPRFWYSIPASMWQGVNFVELGIAYVLSGEVRAPQGYRTGWHFLPKAILQRKFWRPSTVAKFSKPNFRALMRGMSDPGPAIFDSWADFREFVSDIVATVSGAKRWTSK